MEVYLEELSRRAGEYRRNLRGITRALWNGAMSFDQAFADFDDNVRIGLRNAWHYGARQCGIQPADLTPEELTAMRQVIAQEESRVFPFLDWAHLNNKASGGKFGPIKARADMWALRWDDVASRARLMACADKALEWVQGPTSDKCPTCTRMNGKVKRASQWQRNGVHPRAPKNRTIQCEGWQCLCELVPTDKPLSRGPLPRWP